MARRSVKTETEAADQLITIQRLERATVKVHLLGSTALMMNRMAAKARQELLWPKRKLNKAEREQTRKHNPKAEFRDAAYICRDASAPTYLHIPSGAFKKAIAQAALDTPGATKAETGRLVKILDETVHIYGKPFLHMGVVRMNNASKTPDIRTRVQIKEWCVSFTIQYIRTRIREQDAINLVANAGDVVGVGDGRTEKGTFDFGGWELVTPNDPRWNEIAKDGGRKVQLLAMTHPECADEDTEELLSWYDQEVVRREADHKKQAEEPAPKKGKTKIIAPQVGAKRNGKGSRQLSA